MSNKTPNRSSHKNLERSNSANKSKGKIKNGFGQGGRDLLASPYSPESIMTKNPKTLENLNHQAPGIDDK